MLYRFQPKAPPLTIERYRFLLRLVGVLSILSTTVLALVNSQKVESRMLNLLEGTLWISLGISILTIATLLIFFKPLTQYDTTEYIEVYDNKIKCRQQGRVVSKEKYDTCEIYFDEISRSNIKRGFVIEIILLKTAQKSSISNTSTLTHSFVISLGQYHPQIYELLTKKFRYDLRISNKVI